ncbi:MAG: CoA transferase [Pseudomonadales bacterium 32-61-5]|nr:MAG: CoA transferase [Pseudomonadales bacterium 32-61-5]
MGPFPGGKPDVLRSGLYDNSNAGKLGLALDLASPDGQAVVRDLVGWADVVIESFAPGQMARWGLSYAALSAINPGLIMLSTSLMGQSGPLSGVAGFGNIGAAMSGFQNIVGWPGAEPVGPFGPYTDYVAPRFSLLALLAALDHRRRTGEGAWLDVSQVEAGMQFLAPQIAETAATGRMVGAMGNRAEAMAPHGVFRAGDGEAGKRRWVALVARDDADWARLAALIGGEAQDAAFATLAGRKAEEDRLEAVVNAWTALLPPVEVEALVQSIGVPCHVVAGSREMLDDPQLLHSGHFQSLPHPLGGVSVFERSRYTLSETPGEVRRPAPVIGGDTDAVLADFLGYTPDRIAALRRAGVLE